MTLPLFRDDAYLRETGATVLSVNERGGVLLDRTVFYATGGGQPGDRGVLAGPRGECAIATAVYDSDRTGIVHVPAEGATAPRAGDRIVARLDWPTRLARMRVHTALHLLSVALPFPVTGGSIGEGEGRLDFDIPDAGLDRQKIADDVNAMIQKNAAVTTRWIADEELLANPGLVKTMSVKPPMGTGRVRLVEIAGLDLQPCGGTHVAFTGEIGTIAVTAIEKKGKINRRVRLSLV